LLDKKKKSIADILYRTGILDKCNGDFFSEFYLLHIELPVTRKHRFEVFSVPLWKIAMYWAICELANYGNYVFIF